MEDHLQGQLGRTGRYARALAAIALAACSPDAARPPVDVQPLARIELDSSHTVEIVGLRRWTADMVRDSLRKYAPGDAMESDATAANLRNLLGFADAATSVHTVVFDENESSIITIAVREPTDSARVHYAPQALDTVPRRAEWRDIARALADSAGRMLSIVAAAHLDGPSRVVVDSSVGGRTLAHREGYAFESPDDSMAAQPILEAIASKHTQADYDAAIATVDSSTSEADRTIAALILANFADRDGAWRALLKVAIGREQARDAFVAQHALVALSQRAPRALDWSPASRTIHDVLDGTALAALAPLASALAATGASPAQAPVYLAGGGEMLVAYIESDNPDVRDPAHDLLVELRGTDLGFDPAPWRDWIRTLLP